MPPTRHLIPSEDGLAEAADLLRSGRLVAFPTEESKSRRLVIAPPLDRAGAIIARLDAAIECAAHQEHTTT